MGGGHEWAIFTIRILGSWDLFPSRLVVDEVQTRSGDPSRHAASTHVQTQVEPQAKIDAQPMSAPKEANEDLPEVDQVQKHAANDDSAFETNLGSSEPENSDQAGKEAGKETGKQPMTTEQLTQEEQALSDSNLAARLQDDDDLGASETPSGYVENQSGPPSSLDSYKLIVPIDSPGKVSYTQAAKEFFDEHATVFEEYGLKKITDIEPVKWGKTRINVTLLKYMLKQFALEKEEAELREQEEEDGDDDGDDDDDDDDASADHEYDFTNNRGQQANYLDMNVGTLAGLMKNAKLEYDDVKKEMKGGDALSGVKAVGDELKARKHTVRS